MTQLTNCGVITICYLCWSTEMCWHPSSLRRHCAAFSNREKLSGWQCAVLGNSGTLVVLVTFTTKKTKSENDWSCIYKCFTTDDTLKSPTCHINTVIPYLIHWASYDKLSVHLATITCTIAILYSALRVCCKLYSLWEISLHTAWVNLLQQVTIKGIAYISSTCCQ